MLKNFNKGLDRTALKYLAIAAMLTDHFAMFFLSQESAAYFLCRFIGRLTAPIMCYFLAMGYRYTSSKKHYAVRLLSFGIISQIPYALSHYSRLFLSDINMIFTLFISFCILLIYDNFKNDFAKWFLIAVLTASTIVCDWALFAPLWVLLFYIYKDCFKKQMISYSIVSLSFILIVPLSCIANGYQWYSQIWQCGVFLFLAVLPLYNGKGGKNNSFNKWFFYVIYPLHLLIVWIVRFVI